MLRRDAERRRTLLGNDQMTDEIENLVETLTLEPAGADRFRGYGSPFGGARIFGGHLVAQALLAAYETVVDKACHSLSCVFIRAGDREAAVLFAVERVSDGSAFATRRVVAIQGERQILNVALSFQAAEPGFEHQDAAPDAPAPEAFLAEAEYIATLGEAVPAEVRARLMRPRPVEVRLGDPLALGEAAAPRARQWIRSRNRLRPDPRLHQAVLAYASDMGLMDIGMRPHGIDWRMPDVQSASLTHAVWFHRPVDFNDWHLCAQESPVAAGGRALNRCQIFDPQGRLVASVTQESLMRRRG
jgi:acyl-CoA thioesterase II